MEDITYKDAEAFGINTSMIAICRKIRTLAKLDRLRLDDSVHSLNNGLNKHLFDYIKYCGYSELAFIKNYLSNLQPYMIERKKEQEKRKSYICVIDNLYRVSVYIKLDNTQFEEIIVSFHESNKRGVAKTNSLIKVDNEKYVAIFAENILSKGLDNKYVVRALFQRGVLVLPLELAAVKCRDTFIVDKQAINLQFVSYCNDYIRDLYTSDLKIDFSKIEIFSFLQQISFTSYGRDTFSSISILIDSLTIQKDYNSKAVADFALITFIQQLRLSSEQKADLLNLLREKYLVSDIKKIDIILQRITDALLN